MPARATRFRRSQRRFHKPKRSYKAKRKTSDGQVTIEFLHDRATRATAGGYETPRWIQFCRILLNEGFELTMYEAQRTVSKYISVYKPNSKPFKVRFSNHKPIPHRELAGDCDFFVGRTNLRVSTTAMALAAVRKYFSETRREHDNIQSQRDSGTELADTQTAMPVSEHTGTAIHAEREEGNVPTM